MTSRRQNERKFASWEELPEGGRRYLLEVEGRAGWRARYLKEVDAEERTVRFWREILNADGKLIEIHEIFPEDKGHRRLR